MEELEHKSLQKLKRLEIVQTVTSLFYVCMSTGYDFFNNCRPNFLCKSTCITCLVEFTWVIPGEWECLWGQQSAVQSCLVSNDTETETIKMKLLTTQFMSYINSVSLCPTVPFFDLKSSMKRGVCCTRASEKCASRFILAILLNSANTWKIRIGGGGRGGREPAH